MIKDFQKKEMLSDQELKDIGDLISNALNQKTKYITITKNISD